MSRTEDLRSGGARERVGEGAGGGPPFIKWSREYAWVEGHVEDFWTHRKYGDVATLRVTATSGGLEAKGKTEDGETYVKPVQPGMSLNVGLGYATLEGRIKAEDKGKHFHVAFEHWEDSQSGGDPYRMFAVLEIEPREVSDPADPDNEQAGVGVGPGAPGAEQPPIEDDLPF